MFRALRPADLALLVVLFAGACTAAVDICGGRDPIALFALIMGWTWPALRGLMHWRRQAGSRGMRRASVVPAIPSVPFQAWSATMALAVLGGAWWWCILPVAIQLHPVALLTPLGLPNAARWCGVVLALSGLLRPIWFADGRASDEVINGITLDGGLFLVSASPLIGVLAAAGAAVRLSSARAVTS